jgi:hypothetical protein
MPGGPGIKLFYDEPAQGGPQEIRVNSQAHSRQD